MNVLVTGGSGFIGSHLSAHLLSQGHNVYVVDNLSTGQISNIESLVGNPKFSFVEGSILNKALMGELIDQVDWIFHLAAAVGVKYIMEHPINSIRTNVVGTEIILDLASHQKKRVMIASSSEVYGKNVQLPYKESSERLMGSTSTHRWSYAATKSLDEFLSLAYWRERQLPVTIVRLFNVCGIQQTGHYGMVIPNFIVSALKEDTVLIHGDGTQTRCFTDVHDVIRAITELMKIPDTCGEIFNVGSTQEISINQLALRIIELTNSSSEIQYIPYDEAYGPHFEDIMRRVPDISKIRHFIDWVPKNNIDNVLKKIIGFHRELI